MIGKKSMRAEIAGKATALIAIAAMAVLAFAFVAAGQAGQSRSGFTEAPVGARQR
ncbi:MAG: hypothetical protein IJ087_15745 [Eggerthellaceae bacterium]|nr:hypothetical protein [Eggerthellaceae bacterium]